MDETTARHELWRQGIVAAWYLRDDQLPIYELLLKTDRPFIECARRYGKTTTILVFIIERLLQNRGHVALWCEPDKNQAREIVKPEITTLFKTAPKELAPIWNTEDSYYWFPSTGDKDNASKLKLRGVNHDKGDSARGPFANYIVCDEYGFWADPAYTVKEALSPQLQTTRGPLIKASTPPEDLGHAYYDEKGVAISQGRFVQKVIYDNKWLTQSDIDKIIADCGGAETPAFKREYLCLPVSDPEKLVIPEYREDTHDVEDDYPRPEWFDTYVGLDLGFNDNTAAIFGYYDFLKRELVIEDEVVVQGKNSKEISDLCKAKEMALWGGTDETPFTPFCRVGDNDQQQLYDLLSICKYSVLATRKDDKLAAINALRLRFSRAQIKIKKRCKNLRYQLKVGLWNDRKTDFLRGEKTGHLDAVDALIYLSRNVNETHNPFPHNLGVSQYTHFVTPDSRPHGENEALKSAFGLTARRPR